MRILLLFGMLWLPFLLTGQSGDAILGEYWTQDNSARMEFYKKGGKYFAKVIWREDQVNPDGSPLLDVNNSDPSKRNRQVIGINVAYQMSYSDQEWTGIIYDPGRGKEYDVTFQLAADGSQLKMKVWVGFLSATRTWTRIR